MIDCSCLVVRQLAVRDRPARASRRRFALFELRSKLASTLIGHLEDRGLGRFIRGCLRHPDPAVAARARRFSDEMGAAWPARSGSTRSAARR